jgi:hypothetical protein
MIHLGRASQMRHGEAVEATFDTLDSAHDCLQLPAENSATYALLVWHTRCLYHRRKQSRADLNMSATEVRYGNHTHVDP